MPIKIYEEKKFPPVAKDFQSVCGVCGNVWDADHQCKVNDLVFLLRRRRGLFFNSTLITRRNK